MKNNLILSTGRSAFFIQNATQTVQINLTIADQAVRLSQYFANVSDEQTASGWNVKINDHNPYWQLTHGFDVNRRSWYRP